MNNPTPCAEQHADQVMLTLVKAIQSDVNQVKTDVESMQTALKAHIETEPKEWAQVLSDLMARSFPQGDPEGHRKDHETRMKLAEEKAEFWAKMGYELKRWGLIGFALWAIKTLVEAGALWIQHGGHIK